MKKKNKGCLGTPYKTVTEKVINSVEPSYFLFSRYERDKEWYYNGEYDTKEECENDMAMHRELEYIVIKGTQLNYEEGVAVFPFVIKEDENE